MSTALCDSAANALIFWSGNDEDIYTHQRMAHQADCNSCPDTSIDRDQIQLVSKAPGEYKHASAYVDLFETMIRTVVEQESHLLSEPELDALDKLSATSYNARYLLFRLLLRKPGKWHRLASLNYQSEMGDTTRIISAIQELSGKGKQGAETVSKTESKVIIDLTLDDEEEITLASQCRQTNIPNQPKTEIHFKHREAGSSNGPGTGGDIHDPNAVVDADIDMTALAEDESQMSLCDLFGCLTMEELKSIARQVKIKTTQKRPSLVAALLEFCSTQSMIELPAATCSYKDYHDSSDTPCSSLEIFRSWSLRQQGERLREMILKVIVKCVRINMSLYSLFKRIDLVYFRGTEYTQALLTPALLARFRKRYYPSYTYCRTPDIWRTRQELLAYESALELEASIVGEIDGTTSTSRRAASIHHNANPGLASESSDSVMPTTTELDTRSPAHSSHFLKQEKENLREDALVEVEQPDQKAQSTRIKHAQTVKDIFVRLIYPRWKELIHEKRLGEHSSSKADHGDSSVLKLDESGKTVKDESESLINKGQSADGEDGRARQNTRRGLERFDCGHVYTRIVHKCTSVLGPLKDHQLELEVLENLLAQHWWLRGKRGKWHDRRTLILMVHCGKGHYVMRKAMDAVVEALEDDDTHLYYRPMLVRRLVRLEKRLKVALDERHHCDAEMQKSVEVCVKGIRIRRATGSLPPDSTNFDRRSNTPAAPLPLNVAWSMLSPLSATIQSIGSPSKGKEKLQDTTDRQVPRSGKSVWRGQNGEEVNVEILALQHYQRLGYKGYHSEGSIVRTIFGLLFFDIIFASIPGAFETPYQSAPLDIAEDGFYFARKDLIEARLLEIEAGSAIEIVTHVDEEHRDRKTWCVGIRWDLFNRQDLIEIINCLDGKQLSAICRLFCEDYAARSAGLPDLFLWNVKETHCKFVEVKGPGDALQENQKTWIDILLRIGMPVEVCHVSETGKLEKKRNGKHGAERNLKMIKSALDSKLYAGVVLESDPEPDNREPVSSSGGDTERQPKKRVVEQQEPADLPSTSLLQSPNAKFMDHGEVTVFTPPKRRRL